VTAIVVLADDEPGGFARMLAGLIEANLTRRPERSALLRPAIVELEAVDAGEVATVRLRPGRVEVAGGPANPGFHLRIRAPSRDLLELSSAPLLLGFPHVLNREGRSVLGGVVRRRVRVSGMLRHPVVLSRFARLLSVVR
jgi:hypothetical protein